MFSNTLHRFSKFSSFHPQYSEMEVYEALILVMAMELDGKSFMDVALNSYPNVWYSTCTVIAL